VTLASVTLGLPLIVAGAGYLVLGGLLVAVMPETAFQRVSTEGEALRDSFAATARGGRAALHARPALILIFAIAAFHGASTEGFDRLWELHLLRNFAFPSLGDLEPIVWFGIINAVVLLLSALLTHIVRRREIVTTDMAASRALAAINVALVVAVAAYGFAGNFAVALACLWGVKVLRNLNEPVYRAWVNHGLDPTSRATVNSMGSQVDALGQILGGPALGAIGRGAGVGTAIVVSGLIRAPGLLLFRAARRRDAAPVPSSRNRQGNGGVE
jgi:DHA3 family tetracycline resistance protein-like MFS transporter